MIIMIDADQFQTNAPLRPRRPAGSRRSRASTNTATGKTSLSQLPPTLQRLLKEHRAPLKIALERRFGSPPPDPDDAIQTAMLKFMELEGRNTIRNVGAFLFALSRNLMLDEIRHMKVRARYYQRELQEAASTAPSAAPSPEAILLNQERYLTLDDAIKTLPEDAQNILTLSRIENLPYTDISRITGHSTAYISRSIQKSMKTLALYMQRKGWGGE